MAKIDVAAEKWKAHTLAAVPLWRRNVSSAEALESYIVKVADFIGASPDTVRNSLPARNYATFQTNADRYVDAFRSGVETAAKLDKWAKRYKAKFTTPVSTY